MDSKRLVHASAREAAYLACLEQERGGAFLSHTLGLWKNACQPKQADYRLAQQIAYGCTRMKRLLDWWGASLSAGGKLNLKRKERVLLRSALYQIGFLDKVPKYAVADETVKLARKHCHQRFASFLNAVLRKAESLPELPNDLSIRLSYPKWFVEELATGMGEESAQRCLEIMNSTPRVIARDRQSPEPSFIEVEPGTSIEDFTSSGRYYVQNPTPVELMLGLMNAWKAKPKSILDLCAAPGGKTLLLSEKYPHAELQANDRSPDRLQVLEENLDRYEVKATVSCADGEDLYADDKFDLIVIDAPCSNAGVLHKRPEARWRLDAKAVDELNETQLALLDAAKNLLADGGQIWYLTCSILKQENAGLIDRACAEIGLKRAGYEHTQLPTEDGRDGGYACALKR